MHGPCIANYTLAFGSYILKRVISRKQNFECILNSLVFMHKIKSQTAPKIFENKFRKPTNTYRINFSTSSNSIPPFNSSKSKYRPSRFLTLWKNNSSNYEKMQQSVTTFTNSMRKKLLELENEKS